MTGNDLWGKLPEYSVDTLVVKILPKSLYLARGKYVYFVLQDGRQKWWENNFWENSTDDCRYPGGKKFQEFLRIKCFCVLRRNSRWPYKITAKRF